MPFKFEDCLLKHYIRTNVWVPQCQERRDAIKAASGRLRPRRLRYFTFCAEGALDVLLLDRERIILRSSAEEFDTVYFFNSDEDAVSETRKRIPGAIGFPGDFFEIILATGAGIGLNTPAHAENTKQERERQLKQAQRQQFQTAFPFDVLNLDVERYLFRPSEELPGKLVEALRVLLEWQKQSGRDDRNRPYSVDQFSLMFTTRVGPPELPVEYLNYLRNDCLARNLELHAHLKPLFMTKSGGKTIDDFFKHDFDGAFKLTVPKSLIELVGEADWYVDGDRGIEVYQFDRPTQDGSYRMLHMAMTVHRQVPPKEKRGPGQASAAAIAAQKMAIERVFESMIPSVEAIVVGQTVAQLQADLDRLFDHRRRYYDPPQAGT
jgi:hypothetical protein